MTARIARLLLAGVTFYALSRQGADALLAALAGFWLVRAWYLSYGWEEVMEGERLVSAGAVPAGSGRGDQHGVILPDRLGRADRLRPAGALRPRAADVRLAGGGGVLGRPPGRGDARHVRLRPPAVHAAGGDAGAVHRRGEPARPGAGNARADGRLLDDGGAGGRGLPGGAVLRHPGQRTARLPAPLPGADALAVAAGDHHRVLADAGPGRPPVRQRHERGAGHRRAAVDRRPAGAGADDDAGGPDRTWCRPTSSPS